MDMQQMLELLLANHEKAEAKANANRKEMMAETRAETEAMRDKRMGANRESDQEELKGMMEEINAKMDSNQAEMRSIICTFGSELKETIQREMRVTIQSLRSELDETTACNEATETNPDPGMMQSIEETREIPKGEAAVMPVGEPKKWRRVRNLTAECRHKIKEKTQGKNRSKRKSAAACRKVSRRTKVAWRKRNIIWKIRIQVSRESRKELAIARRKVHDTI
jgi:hypothetical protein